MLMVLPGSTDSFARAEAGGKGYNLYIMSCRGLPVPPWVVLGKRFFQAFVNQAGLADGIRQQLDGFAAGRCSAADVSSQIAALFEEARLPDEIRSAVTEAFGKLAHPKAISVRSSAADEDSAAHSFAGQLSSYLYITGEDEAARCLKRCWASAYSERSLAYRKERGLSFDHIAVAAIFQEMIDPDTSGVMFTCDPAEFDRSTLCCQRRLWRRRGPGLRRARCG